jgi:geranylgeranyl pyrophosphate synthase
MPSPRLEAWRQRVEEALDRAVPAADTWPSTIHRAMRHSLLGGGKRLRPLLVLEAGTAVGGDERELLRFACAVEMIHTYSLVHDDLPAMDDDDLRRGRPTCHKVFGEAMAILAGDALLTRAFELMAETDVGDADTTVRRRMAATSILARAGGTTGLIGGQVADLEGEGRAVTAEDVERIHRAKTAALLSACVSGAAALAGAAERERRALEEYGQALGLAFQIVDDVLDATGDAAVLGKTAGKDAEAQKATYVRAHGLERARAMAAELGGRARTAVEPLGERALGLLELARLVVERRA